MNMKWLIAGFVVFLAFVVGMVWLARTDQASVSGSGQTFAQYAGELGLDTAQFARDFGSDAVHNTVTAALNEATTKNLQYTPTFFINGEKQQFETIDDFQKAIDDAAAKSETQDVPNNVHYRGPDTPTVLITEYSDFQCPACGSIEPLLEDILTQNAATTGIIYKHFPLSIHRNAEAAARAAEAAALQGKFWEMHDLLFARQADWS